MSTGEVWVYAEHKENELQKVTFELLGKAFELADDLNREVGVVIAGNNVEDKAKELRETGVSRVYVLDDENLKYYQPLLFADCVAKLCQKYEPDVFLLGATSIGEDLAPRVAAELDTGLTAHSIELFVDTIDGKEMVVNVLPGWGGNFNVEIICPDERPQMSTIKPGVFSSPEEYSSKDAEIIQENVEVKEELLKVKTVEEVHIPSEEENLEEAEVVVCGGWGLRNEGSFELVENLAEVLGGAVSGTRPAVDLGYVPEERMIGVSGKTVSPKLFISIGASGAPHYSSGFDGAEAVLAIDKNANAPIFEYSLCDVGIVGDLSKVVPILIERLSSD